MTRLRRSLKNSARPALFNLWLIAALLAGCTSSTKPTFLKKDISEAIQNICKNEFKIEVKATPVGSTLWIYMPFEDIFEKSVAPVIYRERFIIERNDGEFKSRWFKFDALIKKVPERERFQDYKFNKKVADKINDVWRALRRVLFSMARSADEPKFFCLVTADIKNGFQILQIFYYLDLKKVSYGFISWEEFQHRTIQETNVLTAIIGDKKGAHLKYRDISLEEFLVVQIKQRINSKFSKPEVAADADIDKEIIKIVVHVLKTYNFKDFTAVELNNLLTNNRLTLNEAAIWTKAVE